MDSIADDPELAKELVKLLGQELKVLRAQLKERNETPSHNLASDYEAYRNRTRTAENQVETLKAEIDRLKRDNRQLQDDLDLSRGESNEDEKSLVLQYRASHDKALEQLQDVMKDKQQLVQEIDEKNIAQTALLAKNSRLQEKYKLTKNENEELQEALEILHSDLCESNCARDVAEDRASQAILSQANHDFDIDGFLALIATEVDIMVEQPTLDEILSHSNKLHFSVPKHSEALCSSGGILPLSTASIEILWASSGITGGVVITPSHRFNPVAKNGTGEWQKYTLSMEVGDCRELFLRSKKSWSYLGIFECTDKGKIPVKNHQGPKATFVKGIYKHTVLCSDQVPPLIQKMVPSLYAAGALSMESLGLRRVGFNKELYESLLPVAKAKGQQKKTLNGEASTGTKRHRCVSPERSDQNNKKSKQ